ncbi:MAG: hypothetical protein AAGD86_01050 [Pseudomonadota bacterium]
MEIGNTTTAGVFGDIKSGLKNVIEEAARGTAGLLGADKVAAETVERLSWTILDASADYGVDPMVVGTILYAEVRHRDPVDNRADNLARHILDAVSPAERNDRIFAANRELGFTGKDIMSNMTLGLSQLSVDGVRQLANEGYLGDILDTEAFRADERGTALGLLLDGSRAPHLVAAWAERVIANQSGQQSSGGFTYVDFSSQGDPKAHFVFLTGTYSEGGFFPRQDGQPDASLNSNPLASTDWFGHDGPNASASSALAFRDDVWKALTGADDFNPLADYAVKPEGLREQFWPFQDYHAPPGLLP